MRKILSILIIAILFTGCSTAESFTTSNNSGKEITIVPISPDGVSEEAIFNVFPEMSKATKENSVFDGDDGVEYTYVYTEVNANGEETEQIENIDVTYSLFTYNKSRKIIYDVVFDKQNSDIKEGSEYVLNKSDDYIETDEVVVQELESELTELFDELGLSTDQGYEIYRIYHKIEDSYIHYIEITNYINGYEVSTEPIRNSEGAMPYGMAKGHIVYADEVLEIYLPGAFVEGDNTEYINYGTLLSEEEVLELYNEQQGKEIIGVAKDEYVNEDELKFELKYYMQVGGNYPDGYATLSPLWEIYSVNDDGTRKIIDMYDATSGDRLFFGT